MQLNRVHVYSGVVIQGQHRVIGDVYINQIGKIFEASIVGAEHAWDVEITKFFDNLEEACAFLRNRADIACATIETCPHPET